MLNHNFTLYNLHTELDWPHNLHLLLLNHNFTLYTLQFTIYNLQFTHRAWLASQPPLVIVKSQLYTLQFTIYNLHTELDWPHNLHLLLLNHNFTIYNLQFTIYNLHTELDGPHNLHDGVASSPSTCSCCWICKLLVFLKQMCNMYMARMAQNGPKLWYFGQIWWLVVLCNLCHNMI